jgi:glycosyltransferase involved in cell wall biosynthesis
MKILQIISQLSDFMGDSGQVLRIAKELQQLGHRVSIVTTDGDPFDSEENSLRYADTRKILLDNSEKMTEICGIPVYSLHCTRPSYGMYAPKAKILAKKILEDFDIVHVYSWYHHAGFVFSKTAKELGIPFFISMWGTIQPDAHKFHKFKKTLADIIYTKKIIFSASGLHSIGDSETQEYLKWGCDPKKIHYIDNGVVLDDFKIKNETDIFKRLNLNSEKNFLLYLGRIHEKKGLELLINGFKKISDSFDNLQLIISGTGNTDYIIKLKNLSISLGLEKKIIFTGFVSHDEKLELLKNARLFILTSYSDIHPRAIQEALTMGLPVVFTKVCDYPEIDEYGAGISIDLNVDSIYDAVCTLIQDEKLLKSYSRNAQKLIYEKFLLKEQVKKFETMYLNALK